VENLREIPLPSLPSSKARQYPHTALLYPTPAATLLRFLRVDGCDLQPWPCLRALRTK